MKYEEIDDEDGAWRLVPGAWCGCGAGGTVTINGGTVTAVGEQQSAGIGGK